jgi:hypothetical protein
MAWAARDVDVVTVVLSRILIIVCALIGAIGHAKLTQSQMLRSPRTIFDIAATGVVAMLMAPLGLDTKIMALMGLRDWLPPLLDLPYEAQAAVMLIFGYVFSSALPKLIGLANIVTARWGFEIPLPETGVLVVQKAPLTEKTPEGIKEQAAATLTRAERVVVQEAQVAVAKAAVAVAEAKAPDGP